MDAATVSATAALVASLVTGLVVVFKGGRVVQSVDDLKVTVEKMRDEQVRQGKDIAELKGHVFAPAPRVQGEVNT